MKLIEHVVTKDGVRVIDYLTGDDAYTRDWMSSRRMMYRVRIANPWCGRGRYLAADDGLRKVKESLLR